MVESLHVENSQHAFYTISISDNVNNLILNIANNSSFMEN